jgi:large subunit ribosomal protein L5
MPFIEYYYNNVLMQEFLTKYLYKNVYQLPKLNKIVVSMTLSQTSLKGLLPLISALTIISSQKPFLLTSKRIYITLRVKSGLPVGCKVDLRGKRKFFFLEKLVLSILPRLKEFSVSLQRNVVSISLLNLFIFKEIEKDYEYFPNLPQLKIHLVLNVSAFKEIYDLLVAFRFPVSKLNRL